MPPRHCSAAVEGVASAIGDDGLIGVQLASELVTAVAICRQYVMWQKKSSILRGLLSVENSLGLCGSATVADADRLTSPPFKSLAA